MFPISRRCRILLVALGIAATLPVQLDAQNGGDTFTVHFEETPLADALAEVARETGIDLIYTPNLVEGHTTDCVLKARPVDQILGCLLHNTGLRTYRLDSGTYVLERIEPVPVTRRLTGWVVDAQTGTALPDAHVMLIDMGTGTISGADGLFSFVTPRAGTYVVAVSYVGYRSIVRAVDVGGEMPPLVLPLTSEPIPIAPLVVSGVPDPFLRLGRSILSPSDWMQPNAFGMPDVLMNLNTLMGVRVNDALADVHIQGGEAGEHQFQLDGVPVFEPVHLRGLAGAFSPFALRQVTVHRAGFGVAEGSHLSGVIRAEHRLTQAEGVSQRMDVQIDPLSLNARLHVQSDDPEEEQTRVMIAGRTSLWRLYQPPYLRDVLEDWNTPDPFLPRASVLSVIEADPSLGTIGDTLSLSPFSRPNLGFHDIHGAALKRFGQGRTLHASLYRGWNRLNGNRLAVEAPEDEPVESDEEEDPDTDALAQANRDDYTWSNLATQARYQHVFGQNLLSSLRVRNSRYRLTHTYNALDDEESVQVVFLPGGEVRQIRITDNLAPSDDGNRITEWALDTRLDGVTGDHRWSAGLESAWVQSRFSVEDVYFRPIAYEFTGTRHAFFVQDQIPVDDHTTVEAGLRTTWIPARNRVYAEPRAAVQYAQPESPAGAWAVRGAVGLYRQFVNQFEISSLSPSALLPSVRFWLPVDSTAAPPRAYHLALDGQLEPAPGWTIRLEGYYKRQTDLLMVDYTALWEQLRERTTATKQTDFLERGDGFAYGLATDVQYTTDDLRTSIRYAYGVARRRSPSRFENRLVPVPWSEPHRLNLSADWRPVPDWTALVRVRGIWGRSWGFRRAYYDYLVTDPLTEPVYLPYDLREPEQHRLDPLIQVNAGLAYTRPVGTARLHVRGDVANLINRKNVADLSLEPVSEPDDEIQFDPVPRYLPRFSPSIAIRVEW